MKKHLYIASGNKHKAQELGQMLSGKGFELHDLSALLNYIAPEETGKTFAENAFIKARSLKTYLLQHHKDLFHEAFVYVLADDSGLECDDLGGAPGVYSARYAGPNSTDAQNNAKLIEEIQAVPHPSRRARFVCTLALLTPEHDEILIEDHCEGEILMTAHGQHGFGYDPHFFVESQGKTMAELDSQTKNKISHRAKALKKLLEAL